MPSDRSYRALLAVPWLTRALLGMQVARVAQTMIGLAMVLFTLSEYHSPGLAGLVTFLSIFPGLLVSPIAGALLDRHGRTRLIVIDFLVALVAMTLIGVLSLAGMLPVWLLLLIASVSSLTGPLSATGLRTLFPLMAPAHLWERLNALDSNGYVIATIVGPPIAAALVSVFGGAVAIIVIGLLFGVAALILRPVPEPPSEADTSGRLLADAWQGVVYTWRNRTLRGLGFSISTLNLAGGMVAIVVPLIVIERLGMDEAVAGLVFAVQGIVGVVAGLLAGRMETRGRERTLIAVPTLLYGLALILLLPASGGLGLLVLSMGLLGLLAGPMDVAMFTVRQRRTDPAWMGRAFAVSMSFNFAGFPIGSAVAGLLVAVSFDAAIWFGVVAAIVAGVFALTLIPLADRAVEARVDAYLRRAATQRAAEALASEGVEGPSAGRIEVAGVPDRMRAEPRGGVRSGPRAPRATRRLAGSARRPARRVR